MHGGNAPQVRAAREARILTAEAAREAPMSSAEAADVLTSAMNDSYSLLQRLKVNIANGRLESKDLTALGEWVDRSARIAKLVVDAGIEERRVRISEDQGRQLAVVIQRILGAMLEAIGEMFGNDQFARDRVATLWPNAVAEIVPRELRAVVDGQGPK